ncbi:MAG TPA: hypothetical protein VE261_05060 [Gaiellaceae bacterium]|nr:hypothetical protein [Gaiellaceae bacterium]
MELPLDRDDVDAILIGLFNANRKLDDILDYLEIDGEEEAEEPSDS